MEVDYGAARFWFDVAHLGGLFGLGVYTWIVNRTKANRGAIDRVDSRVSAIDLRLSQLETDVRHLPDHDDLGEIHEKVNTIAGSMKKIEGHLDSLNGNFALLFQDRLNQGGSK
ncbi:DUF2730 family protein [Sedimenticola hydrogenitrophicus]|uniref:DUF2730 family protein n=1 Tax=Sedimenticola hydrogenitrophicus TaxID=2967975 RepID=UPI0023AFBAE4|nr:DUF2730 family protein [Sedimenticola hydrogenitrophicus]